jgi:hypothetical protein
MGEKPRSYEYKHRPSAAVGRFSFPVESAFSPNSPNVPSDKSPEIAVDVESTCPYIVTFYDAYTDPDQGGSYH